MLLTFSYCYKYDSTDKKINRSQSADWKYSILIPTWNNLEYLKLCIGSIKKNSTFQHQIIVLINEGSDGTLEWLKTQPDIDSIHSQANIGICYGLNICRSFIATPYLVYLNDDMYVLPGWDKEFDKEISSLENPKFILSGTMIEPIYTGNLCVVVKNYGNSFETFQEELLLNEFSQLVKDDWFGSTWPPIILPLDLWDLVGGMSIEFSPGVYSDPDLSMKLWQAGVRIFKGVGSSKVYHFGSKSTNRIKKNKGINTFLMKWGITSGSFVNLYLRRGQKYTGVLKEPLIPFKSRLKNKLKRIKNCL